MEKMMKRSRQSLARKDNKGFTLIELIIVIAILAVLVAILAPQYLQYVEKSRISADEATASELMNASKVAASDPDVALAVTYKVTWPNAGGAPTYTTTAQNTAYEAAVSSAVGTLPAVKSVKYKGQNYTVTITVSSGNVSVAGSWA